MSILPIDSRTVEYEVRGADAGAPVVVFLNGHRMPMSNWDPVLGHLAGIGTLLRYNRPGVGASDAATKPQDGLTIISELNGLLEALALDAPILLVGHSLGGLYAILYARRYPERLRGLVLVESGHPEEALLREANLGFLGKIADMLLGLGKTSFRNDPNSEYNSVPGTVQQIAEAPAFPDLPLVVVTGTQKMPFVPRQAFDRHLAMQDRLALLAPHSTHLKADKSGHFPQLSEPALVANAIADAAALHQPRH